MREVRAGEARSQKIKLTREPPKGANVRTKIVDVQALLKHRLRRAPPLAQHDRLGGPVGQPPAEAFFDPSDTCEDPTDAHTDNLGELCDFLGSATPTWGSQHRLWTTPTVQLNVPGMRDGYWKGVTLDGPSIIAHSLSRPGKIDRYGNAWQYHSRSDRHSKIACWAIMFDLLQHCSDLRDQAAAGRVVVGINQEMRDFHSGRKKDLDLVVARPAGGQLTRRSETLADLAVRWNVRLDAKQRDTLAGLPPLASGDTGSVLIALEAKAAMTAHIKALPRLYDELNSSHLTVHGAIESALAIGYVLVNAANTFVSSEINKWPLSERTETSQHRQPLWAQRTVAKIDELPRRSTNRGVGFDALGITLIDFPNDGGPVSVHEGNPAPDARSDYHYDQMILRIAQQYAAAHGHL